MSEKSRDINFLKLFGKNLRSIRESKEMSQEEFSSFCDIDTRQLGRIERGESNSTILTVKKIADKLNLPIKELFEI
ncbi:helix-turn-helix domain-containing protein [Sphingobacterium hotanense]|uniref:Helix-turn-helix transcriptional regulator n=1 Tax=Sphingobacterium hotanense TaxID=649196 RepID=A0ABT7NKH4_9SPHI|nr:helix-turn-helix transcriptional regulator [Sphingobacterium hotanense]MDM1047722.1 helix-turn-helix transcriptional regulator [Sphingobacterium hotanense]